MAEILGQLWNKRKTISSASSDESTLSPESKKTKSNSSPTRTEQDDEVMSALNISQDLGATLQAILAKLDKLDTIESAVNKIEAKLENLEKRTQTLEEYQTTSKKDIEDLKDGLNFTGQQLNEKMEGVKKAHQIYEGQLAELAEKVQKNEELIKEVKTKNLYLESYSRRENIKFTNINQAVERAEDTEDVLRTFLEEDLGYRDARTVEIQRVHRIGKSKDGKPRPILARFLRYKDCQQIFSLGHRLKETDFQMFRDLPQEIISRRKTQMEAFKEARKHGVAASFSQSQPDKLYIRGKLWPIGQKFTV
ncbi:uncharacterized protein LOC144640896 [Oculina patagonica]